MLGKIRSFLKGWWNYLSHRHSEMSLKRLLICEDCPFRKGYLCGKCGCFLVAKSESDDEDCPIGFWPKIKKADPN